MYHLKQNTSAHISQFESESIKIRFVNMQSSRVQLAAPNLSCLFYLQVFQDWLGLEGEK